MLQISADIFSGQPNPSWVVADEAEARATLRDLVKDRQVLSSAPPADAGLGFRGLVVEPLSDELAGDFELSGAHYLAAGPQGSSRANEIAERLISLMSRSEPSAAMAALEQPMALDETLRGFLSMQLERSSRSTVADAAESPSVAAAPEASAGEISPVVTCQIELGAFNPGFWNTDPNVRSRNNCYNYASNKRTDTFAQPGRGCSNMYKAITCAEMTRAALCDGLHRRFDCFLDSEKPRYLVALVVAPGPGFVDFHWYRKQKEGFWGHKPGGTLARNVDNGGRVIMNPETCDRGPYTLFCGYFYTCRSQKIR